ERRSPLGSRAERSAQPGREQRLDLAAVARRAQPGPDPAAVDDEQRRDRVDPEAADEVRPLLRRDSVQPERLVVSPALEDLRDVRVDLATAATRLRVEEHEARGRDGTGGRLSELRHDHLDQERVPSAESPADQIPIYSRIGGFLTRRKT